MARRRLYLDGATKQRAYRERLKARRREVQGPSDAELARVVREWHVRLEYAAAVHPGGSASRLAGKDALKTLRNTLARLAETEQI
jgi:hypothetical protein